MPTTPREKMMLDAVIDSTERDSARRQWRFWLAFFGLSIVAWFVVFREWFDGYVQLGLVIFAIAGVAGFLVFLSTKPFGRVEWWGWPF